MAEARDPDAPRRPEGGDRARRRARLDAVFGEVLPDTTGDERDGRGDGGRTEADYRAERPPHHGD